MPILMCPPTHYGVEYEINPWMHVTSQVDRRLARHQWEALLHTYRELGVEVVLADPVPGLPDMVFTANAGLTRGDRVVLSRFRHPERQREESRWRELFESWGAPVCDTGDIAFEGAGDALFVGDTLVCGYGFRTDPEAIPLVARQLGVDARGRRAGGSPLLPPRHLLLPARRGHHPPGAVGLLPRVAGAGAAARLPGRRGVRRRRGRLRLQRHGRSATWWSHRPPWRSCGRRSGRPATGC